MNEDMQEIPSIYYDALYADNTTWSLAVELVLSRRDWRKFQNAPFYEDLKKWLSDLGNPEIKDNLAYLERKLNSVGTGEEGNDCEYVN